jgi:hypothetical protein
MNEKKANLSKIISRAMKYVRHNNPQISSVTKISKPQFFSIIPLRNQSVTNQEPRSKLTGYVERSCSTKNTIASEIFSYQKEKQSLYPRNKTCEEAKTIDEQ